MQETSHRPADRGNVVREQCKSDRQHPNTDDRQRQKTEHSTTDERDTSRNPRPRPTLPTKAAQIVADPFRDMILEALHFLVEIGNHCHIRSSDMHLIRSYAAKDCGFGSSQERKA